ncbi:hypothetical protein OG426_08025 [Streptomyces canus]|nr:hypothetical protein [Streptomyces canus]MCX4852344.1 hypothetical protein [Streptomyces canus]WSW32433.1 hypothetical protein OG426_08025 [Streptomyces canus]
MDESAGVRSLQRVDARHRYEILVDGRGAGLASSPTLPTRWRRMS